MVGRTGIEPVARWLRVSCSASSYPSALGCQGRIGRHNLVPLTCSILRYLIKSIQTGGLRGLRCRPLPSGSAFRSFLWLCRGSDTCSCRRLFNDSIPGHGSFREKDDLVSSFQFDFADDIPSQMLPPDSRLRRLVPSGESNLNELDYLQTNGGQSWKLARDIILGEASFISSQ